MPMNRLLRSALASTANLLLCAASANGQADACAADVNGDGIVAAAKPDRVGPFFEQASEIMRNFTVR